MVTCPEWQGPTTQTTRKSKHRSLLEGYKVTMGFDLQKGVRLPGLLNCSSHTHTYTHTHNFTSPEKKATNPISLLLKEMKDIVRVSLRSVKSA
eukprot:1085600-Pelagomonas_calceolata.AAC.1